MAKVIKRKGTIEPFIPEKIKRSLQKATIESGYSLKEKKDVIDKIYDKISKKFEKEGKIRSENIRMCILTELDKCEPYIAKSWRRFETEYKSRQ